MQCFAGICGSAAKKPIAVGDSITSASVDVVGRLYDAGYFEGTATDFKTLCAGKKVVLLGQPGAFTPC
jgi:peroxiredoxin